MDLKVFPPEPLVPAEEIQAIGNVVSSTLATPHTIYRSTIGDMPTILHHYTNSAGLIGIIESGVLRAGHIGYMNDASEYFHAIDMFCDLAKDQSDKSAKPLHRELFALLGSASRTPIYPPLFVACFSATENSLNQWRAYAGGEGGFALGMDYKKIIRKCSEFVKSGAWAWLSPVVYNQDHARLVLNTFLQNAAVAYEDAASGYAQADREKHLNDWVKTFFSFAIHVAPLFKNESFVEEREWRITFRPRSLYDISFQPRPNCLSAFVEIALGEQRQHPTDLRQDHKMRHRPMPDRLPIAELWVGPGRLKDISEAAARRLLGNCDYTDVPIKASSIPYRII